MRLEADGAAGGRTASPIAPVVTRCSLVLDGLLHITIDGTPNRVEPGNVALVRAGAEVIVDGGPQGAGVWVTTTRG